MWGIINAKIRTLKMQLSDTVTLTKRGVFMLFLFLIPNFCNILNYWPELLYKRN